DLAVDQKRVDRLWRPDVEDRRSVLLGDDQRAAAMDAQRRVPDGQEADRSERFSRRQWCTGKVNQLAAAIVAKRLQVDLARSALSERQRDSRPVCEIVEAGRAETAEITRQQHLDAG